MSFGACGAYAPLAGPSPAPAADAAGRVKSRRPDWLKIKPHIDFGCGAFSSSRRRPSFGLLASTRRPTHGR
ncbi:MAG TPA: hypothetical protein VF865_16990 [Acidobacteriaceae bacterium]